MMTVDRNRERGQDHGEECASMLPTAKLNGKFQVTVPTQVRKALHLKAGDCVGFEIKGNEVRLLRASPLDLAFAQALEGTPSEWSSAADDAAFKDLAQPSLLVKSASSPRPNYIVRYLIYSKWRGGCPNRLRQARPTNIINVEDAQ